MQANANIWHWLIEFVACISNRHRIGQYGVAFYKRVTGREANVTIEESGEKASYHVIKHARISMSLVGKTELISAIFVRVMSIL